MFRLLPNALLAINITHYYCGAQLCTAAGSNLHYSSQVLSIELVNKYAG